jgi:hypothetical protein
VNEDLILTPEVQARRALRERRIRLQMLVPPGTWFGCGRLRVLRVKMNEPFDKDVEMTVGYEAYES